MRQFSPPLTCISVRLVDVKGVAQFARDVGYDALYVDFEHSRLGALGGRDLVGQARDAGLLGFVRSAGCHISVIEPLLAVGVDDVLVPGIHTTVAAHRSAMQMSRSALLAQAPRPTFGVMIESRTAVAEVTDILAAGDFAYAMFGCTDLRREISSSGHDVDQQVCKAIASVGAAVHAAGKTFMVGGTWTSQPFLTAALDSQADLVTVGSDSRLFERAAREAKARFRAGLPPLTHWHRFPQRHIP